MQSVVAYACDVGSTRPDKKGHIPFGWARATIADSGIEVIPGDHDVEHCIHDIRRSAATHLPIALGMECPLYIPIPSSSTLLSCGREGEGSRSCFAPAGGYVAMLGLHQLAYILRSLRGCGLRLHFDWSEWCTAATGGDLLLWEAFVCSEAHADRTSEDSGIEDAQTAVHEFAVRYQAGALSSDVGLRAGTEALSLAGCAALWAGLDDDLLILRKPVLVVKPSTRHR